MLRFFKVFLSQNQHIARAWMLSEVCADEKFSLHLTNGSGKALPTAQY